MFLGERLDAGMQSLADLRIVVRVVGLVIERRFFRIRHRLLPFPRTAHSPPSRIGGWNASPVSHGKKIQVSCDTSVMKVSTSGRPIGLA